MSLRPRSTRLLADALRLIAWGGFLATIVPLHGLVLSQRVAGLAPEHQLLLLQVLIGMGTWAVLGGLLLLGYVVRTTEDRVQCVLLALGAIGWLAAALSGVRIGARGALTLDPHPMLIAPLLFWLLEPGLVGRLVRDTRPVLTARWEHLQIAAVAYPVLLGTHLALSGSWTPTPVRTTMVSFHARLGWSVPLVIVALGAYVLCALLLVHTSTARELQRSLDPPFER